MDRGDAYVLVEVLPPLMFHQAHLPNAVNLPPQQVEERVATLVPDKNAEVVVYCESVRCEASRLAAEKLEKMGYANLSIYEGGKEDWMSARLPVEIDPLSMQA